MTTVGTAPRARVRPLAPRGRAGAPVSRRWPLSRWFTVGAAATAVLLVLAVTLGSLALSRLADARRALLDTVGPALETGQQLSLGVLDQETGVRGYGLTARPEFLEPYRSGVAAEQEAVATLMRLAADGDLEQLDLDVMEVERATQAWRTGFAEPAVAAVATPGLPAADPERGLDLFDEVRATVDTLIDGLRAEQAAARQRVAGAAALVSGVGIGIAAVLAGFLTVAGIGLRHGVLRPLSHLAAEVREVVSGDVQRPVRADGPREIVELGEDVESMRIHILRELARAQEANVLLDAQARDLERSNRDLEQFAYVASHDLQEPLRKVSSFCQLLQRRYGGQLDERADQYIEFAVDGASRMQRLINDLLAFSRVGRTSADFVTVDLDEAAAAAAAQLETARAEAEGEIVLGELPTVRGDPGLLRQLLVNLIGNGLKFHREGVPPVVEVSARRNGDRFEIDVSDNGIGIEPEYTDKVFVIFQRLHGRDLYPGTGIGLALAKKIVEFHDGTIRIDTGDGPGTTVHLTFPAPSEETPA